MQYTTVCKQQLADTITPVSIFASLREQYGSCLLLESSDYHTKENSYSIICCDSLEQFVVNEVGEHVEEELAHFIQNISTTGGNEVANRFNSVFGFSTYEAVQCFETIEFASKQPSGLPLLRYEFYRYILVFEQFTEQLYWIENIPEGEQSKLPQLQEFVEANKPRFNTDFKKIGPRSSNLTDSQYSGLVSRSKHFCQIGDVFQIVPSRKFEQKYEGDNFIVYRSLRSINPSPFCFYFDYGAYQIFGASPEAQLLVRNGVAEIHPIAGTFKRTGNDDEDAREASRLFEDPKENSEHIMLVDLARNDLSRSAKHVEVTKYREIQFYSHVIHLVSLVKGDLPENKDSKQLYADTFPAGTLSGAPKYRAMELIDEFEPSQRGIYGGAIGAFGLNGDINHAIGIRTFLAKNNKLIYQAGAGIVIDSNEELETQEVYHKLRALEMAMTRAEELSST